MLIIFKKGWSHTKLKNIYTIGKQNVERKTMMKQFI